MRVEALEFEKQQLLDRLTELQRLQDIAEIENRDVQAEVAAIRSYNQPQDLSRSYSQPQAQQQQIAQELPRRISQPQEQQPQYAPNQPENVYEYTQQPQYAPNQPE